MAKAGSRVFAVQKASETEVFIYGYGVYDGDFEAPVGPFNTPWEEFDRDYGSKVKDYRRPTNPRITLDDGQVVWGMQCWWGSEEVAEKTIAGREVVIVPVEPLG